jgi:hypothetical protein
MIAPAQVARCLVAPVNTLLAISRHTTSFRILTLMPDPYWTTDAVLRALSLWLNGTWSTEAAQYNFNTVISL